MMRLEGGRGLLDREVSKPKNIGATLRRFGQYFEKYWIGLAVSLLLIVAGAWTQVTYPELIGQAIDCYLTPQIADVGQELLQGVVSASEQTCTYAVVGADATIDEKLAGLGGLTLLLVALIAGGAVFNGMAFYAMNWTGQHVLRDMRDDLFRHMQRLSFRFYSENEAGDLMSRITSDTDTIQQVMSFGLLSVLSGALLMVWIMIRMLQADVLYALLSLTVVPVMIIATVYFSTQARRAFRKSRQEMGSVNADLQESIAGVREVQAFNREEESIENFRRTNASNRDANVRAAAFTSALNPILEALGYVALGIVVVVGGISALNNAPLLGIGTTVISAGLIITFLQYVQRFNQPIQQIALLWTNIQSAIAGGERIFGLLDKPVDIAEKPAARKMSSIVGKVEFVNVSAEYKKDEPVLKDISFEAQAGQMVAIVGPTGAGKTTIINLIPRFYDVTGGAVKIDGIDVRDVTLDSLRSQIGIVLQDTFLFSDTVMNNIRYGRLDATDEEVIEAARIVAADTFVEKLPEGFQTVLGERGGGLSQGQRQLIAIARVALMKPHILILDEATSSVDTRTERLIQKAFEKLLEGRTSFVIAHRLSTIRNADMVMMLQDGQIIERGTHHELLQRQGAYYELYMSQFRHQEETVASNGASPEMQTAPGK